ncbi:hypothetical protein EHS13_22960 [Paenibacillus psychroresistens]|uniref:Uncharacterized protein n=1 Tax=Paenibacillus psychroresistens TaxID=1778678 RepID=A0A6B8RPV8_9BACL|nr:hypothetical protein [Paenibacillus psychroresistens]QGQ97543.1 hypothetical protein EHS13_22960 [Paenibacillus psychroresistens]
MKRWFIYVVPILLIILGAWLFINPQGNKSVIENSKQEILPTNTVGKKAIPVSVAVSNEKSKVRYLAPLYDVNVKSDIVYASKKNETDTEQSLKFDLYEPVVITVS